jgi:hypothetical protein
VLTMTVFLPGVAFRMGSWILVGRTGQNGGFTLYPPYRTTLEPVKKEKKRGITAVLAPITSSKLPIIIST